MKIYARMMTDGEANQCVIFDLKPARLGVLRNLCAKHNLAEVCVKLEGHQMIPFETLPQGGPLDGFLSQESQDELAAIEIDDVADLDLGNVVLEMLHVAKDRIHVEIIFSDEVWWSEPIMIEEIERWTSK